MRRILLLILIAGTVPSIADTEKPSITEYRKHFQVVDGGGAVLYVATEVIRYSEASNENYVLASDQGHGDFVLRKIWTFKDQVSALRVSDIKDRTYIQASYKYPFSSTTRTATLEEGRRNPQIMEVGTLVRIETNGGRWDGTEHDWDDGIRLRDFRHQLRQTIDFSLLEAVERMRGTLFATEIASWFYSPLCKYAVYDANDEGGASTVKVREIAPDCAFDAHFGFECSEKQLARVKKAAKEEKILTAY
jgi:hypothetical protein